MNKQLKSKHESMQASKWLLVAFLVIALCVTSVVPTWAATEAAEGEKTLLTFEEALRLSLANDVNLKTQAKTLQQLEDGRERIVDITWDTRPGDVTPVGPAAIITDITTKNLTLAILQTDLNMRSVEIQRRVEKERIEFVLQNLFNEIRETQLKQALLEDKLDYLEVLVHQEQLKRNNGMSSPFMLDQLMKERDQQVKNREILQQSMNNLYQQLAVMTGLRNIHQYEAEIMHQEFRPLESTDETVLVSRALSADPYMAIQRHEVEKAERDRQLFTYTGPDTTPFSVREAEVDKQILKQNRLREELQKVVEQRISQLRQLEQQIAASTIKIKQLDEQLRVLNLQHELGMIIQNDLTEKELERNSEIKNLEDLEQSHALLRTLVEKPYIVPDYMK